MVVGKGTAVVMHICTYLGIAIPAFSFGNLFREAVSGTHLFQAISHTCSPAFGSVAYQSDLVFSASTTLVAKIVAWQKNSAFRFQ